MSTPANPVPTTFRNVGAPTPRGQLTLRPLIFVAGASPPPPGVGFEVLLASPVASNAFEVVFTGKPVGVSNVDPASATNRLNYTLSVTSGGGTFPVVTSVVDLEPADDVQAGAWRVRVNTDRRLLLDTTYLVVVSNVTREEDGAGLAPAPGDRASFLGAAVARPLRQPRPVAVDVGVDFFYDFFGGRAPSGAYVLDAKSDYDVHAGREALRKRVIRRIISSPGGFFHLPRYGVGLRVKEPLRTTDLNDIQETIQRQVDEEPDVLQSAVQVALVDRSVLFIQVTARTRRQEVRLEFEAGPDAPLAVLA